MPKNDKQDRFDRVAYARTEKIIEMLKLLGNCSNINNYEYGEKQVEAIFRKIDAALKGAKREFELEIERSKKKK